MTSYKDIFKHQQAGFTFVEILVSLGFLIALTGSITIQLKNMRKHISATESLLTVDAMEVRFAGILGNKDVVESNVRRSGSARLRGCMLDSNKKCSSRPRKEKLAFTLPGDDRLITGSSVFYDFQGRRCKDKCVGFQVETFITVRCTAGKTCFKPAIVTVEFQIMASKFGKSGKRVREIVRKGYTDMLQSEDRKFPNLNLACNGNGVLRGVGINNQPICTSIKDVTLVDRGDKPSSGTVNVKPFDCSALNDGRKDQYHVTGIDAAGKISCAPRFWE